MASLMAHRIAGAVVAGWILASVAWMAWAAITWPALRTEAMAQQAAEIAREDGECCRRLGLGPETGAEAFARCAQELALVRRRQEERRDIAGLL